MGTSGSLQNPGGTSGELFRFSLGWVTARISSGQSPLTPCGSRDFTGCTAGTSGQHSLASTYHCCALGTGVKPPFHTALGRFSCPLQVFQDTTADQHWPMAVSIFSFYHQVVVSEISVPVSSKMQLLEMCYRDSLMMYDLFNIKIPIKVLI